MQKLQRDLRLDVSDRSHLDSIIKRKNQFNLSVIFACLKELYIISCGHKGLLFFFFVAFLVMQFCNTAPTYSSNKLI